MTLILVVEDELGIARIVRDYLTHEGFEVEHAADGDAALIVARNVKPDLIVLDLSMPGMSGFEVAVRLRAAGSTIPIVFLTVHDDEDFVRAAKAAGGIGYVVKPQLASDLLMAVLEARAGRTYISRSR